MSDYFPSSPIPGESYTTSDGTIWTWDGLSWTSSGFGGGGTGGISNVKVSSGTTTISANGVNFVNTATVLVTVSTGTNGNADIQLDGSPGPQGFQGRQGSQGIQGFQGRQGFQGVQGLIGIQGAQGFQGIQGFQGVQGLIGIQGAQGRQGAQGFQGVQGSSSAVGSTTEIQFNDGGVFGSNANLTFSKTQSLLGVQGQVVITSSLATDALRITQTGTGNAIVVEDSTNPDLTPFAVNANGSVGIGGAADQYRSLKISRPMGFPNPDIGFLNNANVASDLDSSIYYNKTLATIDTGLAITELVHYQADSGSFNSSEVLYQYGFYSMPLSGGVQNYGFYSQIPPAAENWNFYASTLANNFFSGSIGIDTTLNLDTYKLNVAGKTQLTDANITGTLVTSIVDRMRIYGKTKINSIKASDYYADIVVAANTYGEGGVTGITFKPDGTKYYTVGIGIDRIQEYNISTPWNLSTASFSANSVALSTNDSQPGGIAFSSNGTYVYIAGQALGNVSQYILSTPWSAGSLISATANLVASYNVAPDMASTTSLRDVTFSDNGSYMYVSTGAGTKVIQYYLSQNWNVASATFLANSGTRILRSTGTIVGALTSVNFLNDGALLYTTDSTYKNVHFHSMETAWLVSSNISYLESITLPPEGASYQGSYISPDGKYLSVVESALNNVYTYKTNTSGAGLSVLGDTNIYGNLYSYSSTSTSTLHVAGDANITSNVTVGGDVILANASVAKKTGVAYAVYSQSYSVAAQETEPRDVFFSSDGTKFYILGNTGNDVTQYTLGTAWDLSGTVTADGQYSVATQETAPYGVAFGSNGTYLYVVGGNNTVYRYTLTTPWSVVGTVTFNHSYSVAAQDTGMHAVSFSSDGTKMFVLGQTNDDVYQYTLTTAWDLSGTVTYNGSYAPTSRISSPQGLHFSSDGTKMWILDSVFQEVSQHILATPWVITSGVTYDSYITIAQSAEYSLISGISGIYVDESIGAMFIADYTSDRLLKYNINNTPVLTGNGWSVDGDLLVKKNINTSLSMHIGGTITGFGGSFNGTLSSINFSGYSAAIAGTVFTNLTTGSITIGGTSQTGTIILGQSTAAQLVAIASGVTAASTTKTVNIAAVLSNITSTTNVNIGTLTSGNVNIVLGSSAATNSQITLVGNTTIGNVTFEDRFLSRAMTRDIGSVYVDKGTQTTGTITFDYTGGSLQRLQVGGALTIAFSNFPPTSNMGMMQVELVNGGSAVVTFPTINWIKKDGTFTTSITTYLTDFGRAALQTSGTDFFIVWTRDAGTTVYGKLL